MIIRYTDYNFGDRMQKLVRGYLRKENIFQEDFARLMKMTPGDFSRLINGNRGWTLKTLYKIKDILKVTIQL